MVGALSSKQASLNTAQVTLRHINLQYKSNLLALIGVASV